MKNQVYEIFQKPGVRLLLERSLPPEEEKKGVNYYVVVVVVV